MRLHQEALDGLPGAAPLPNPKGASQRLLRLVGRASICPSKRRSSSVWLDQTCLARKQACTATAKFMMTYVSWERHAGEIESVV